MKHGDKVLVDGIALGEAYSNTGTMRVSFPCETAGTEIEVNISAVITRDLYDGLQCIINDRTKDVLHLQDDVEKLQDALFEEANVNATTNAKLAAAEDSINCLAYDNDVLKNEHGKLLERLKVSYASIDELRGNLTNKEQINAKLNAALAEAEGCRNG